MKILSLPDFDVFKKEMKTTLLEVVQGTGTNREGDGTPQAGCSHHGQHLPEQDMEPEGGEGLKDPEPRIDEPKHAEGPSGVSHTRGDIREFEPRGDERGTSEQNGRNYLSAHVPPKIVEKIIRGEYVEFGSLIVENQLPEDQRFELVSSDGGVPKYKPVSQSKKIDSWNRWQQAFRVYFSIYTVAYPSRITGLLEFENLIQVLSTRYPWNSVYNYERKFRIALSSETNPKWGVPDNVLMTTDLLAPMGKEKPGPGPVKGQAQNRQMGGQICFAYNAGKCTYGDRCKFEHRCSRCKKYGHSELTCRMPAPAPPAGNQPAKPAQGGAKQAYPPAAAKPTGGPGPKDQ